MGGRRGVGNEGSQSNTYLILFFFFFFFSQSLILSFYYDRYSFIGGLIETFCFAAILPVTVTVILWLL